MLPVLPGGIVALGIALIVMKVTKKNSGKPLVAAQPAGPDTTSPMNLSPAPAVPTAVLTPIPPPAPRVACGPRPQRLVPVRVELSPRPLRQRLTEAISAMLFATMLSVIAAVLVASVMRLNRPEEWALLAATCLAGCWAVLIPGKLWEGSKGDPVRRRMFMSVLGLGVGLWASYLDGLLGVGWYTPPETSHALLVAPGWVPQTLTNASYFGLVFLVPRWWLLADSRRGLRFNPWLVIVPCFCAWMASFLWGPRWNDLQLYGIVVTGMVAVLVQLASPWEEPASRRRAA
jgi:hypothetical protein